MWETNVLSKQIWAQIHLQRCSLFAQGREGLPEAALVSWANTLGPQSRRGQRLWEGLSAA